MSWISDFVPMSIPAVGAALLVGLAVSVFQATTQIQEQTVSFAPKLLAVLIAEAIAAPWTGQQLVRFTTAIFEAIRAGRVRVVTGPLRPFRKLRKIWRPRGRQTAES